MCELDVNYISVVWSMCDVTMTRLLWNSLRSMVCMCVCVCVLSINIQYTKYTLFVRNDYILISDQFAVVYIRTYLLKSIRLSLHTFRFT